MPDFIVPDLDESYIRGFIRGAGLELKIPSETVFYAYANISELIIHSEDRVQISFGRRPERRCYTFALGDEPVLSVYSEEEHSFSLAAGMLMDVPYTRISHQDFEREYLEALTLLNFAMEKILQTDIQNGRPQQHLHNVGRAAALILNGMDSRCQIDHKRTVLEKITGEVWRPRYVDL